TGFSSMRSKSEGIAVSRSSCAITFSARSCLVYEIPLHETMSPAIVTSEPRPKRTMRLRVAAPYAIAVTLLSSCATPSNPTGKLTVAAAANLTDVFAEVGRGFQAKTGVDVVFSYGSTAQLAQQIDHGAHFD